MRNTAVRDGVRRCALILWIACAISACGRSEVISWKEQVALHDGTSIVVDRTMTVGHAVIEPGAHSTGITNYTLSFVAPDGRSTLWESPAKLTPMILDFVDGVPYLAFRVRAYGDFSNATERFMTSQVIVGGDVGALTSEWTASRGKWVLRQRDF